MRLTCTPGQAETDRCFPYRSRLCIARLVSHGTHGQKEECLPVYETGGVPIIIEPCQSEPFRSSVSGTDVILPRVLEAASWTTNSAGTLLPPLFVSAVWTMACRVQSNFLSAQMSQSAMHCWDRRRHTIVRNGVHQAVKEYRRLRCR